jgi:4-hydroxyacetophenone monooxygenase
VTRSFHVGQPFTTATADIAAALEQVSIPTLLLSLVHITGDPRFIRATPSTRSRSTAAAGC